MKVLTAANAEDLNARRVNPSLFPVIPYQDNAQKVAPLASRACER